MYKDDLALNNLQWLICHKTKPSSDMKWFQLTDAPAFSTAYMTDAALTSINL